MISVEKDNININKIENRYLLFLFIGGIILQTGYYVNMKREVWSSNHYILYHYPMDVVSLFCYLVTKL